MKPSQVVSLVVSVVMAGVVLGAPADAARARGWTDVPSPYAGNALTPDFDWCEVSERRGRITLRLRAIRPRPAVLSQAVTWNSARDFSGVSGDAFDTSWSGDTSVMTFTMPKRSFLTISYQTSSSGYGYGETRRPPLGLDRCP